VTRVVARAGPPSVHALGIAAAALALLGTARVLPVDAPPLSLFPCPIRAATGWPCLTCGCTHAFAAVVRFDLSSAFHASPLGAVLAIACAAHLLWTALRCLGLRWGPAIPTRIGTAALPVRVAAVVLLAANWAYVAAHGPP
jgi:hypothetical protein